MKGSESVWVSTQRLQYPGFFIPMTDPMGLVYLPMDG